MDFIEIFKDSLIYPTKDLNKLVILGALLIIIVVLTILTLFSVILMNFIFTAIFTVITVISAIIIGLIYNGYGLRITKETIENNEMSENIDTLPNFNWSENLVDGIKVLILDTVYMIIPIIIAVILAYALGLFSSVPLITQFTANSYLSNPNLYLNQFSTSLTIVQGLFTILALIFSLFAMIARAKLAETSRLSSIFEFEEIINTIAKIGWGNYIIWFILLMVILFMLGSILGIIMLIPIIGTIIGLLIIPGLLIFESRAVGLIYNESKK